MDRPEILCRVNFPLYQATMVSPRHILLGGGGGAAKTGVHNGFEIFEIGFNGSHCVAESVTRYSTGEFAVMNVSACQFDPLTRKTLIAVGQDEKCRTFELKLTRDRKGSVSVCEEDDADGGGDHQSGRPRRRRLISNGDAQAVHNDEESAQCPDNSRHHRSFNLVFDVRPLKSVQTDFNLPEPYQKVVRISADGHLMATGGDDGVLRVWTFPDLNRIHEIEAHEKEIDDITFTPDGSKVFTISKDRRAIIWDIKKGKKHAEMGWDPPNGIKYMYKRLRLGRVEGEDKKYKIFAIVNPVGASRPPSFLQRWNTKSYTVEGAVAVGGSLSALAVSDNGQFVATGTMFDGTVDIFVAFSLQRLKRVEKSHSTFITGLEFLPTTLETETIRGFSEVSVVSVSVDHYVCIHHIARQRTISMTSATIVIVLLLFATFLLCSYLGI